MLENQLGYWSTIYVSQSDVDRCKWGQATDMPFLLEHQLSGEVGAGKISESSLSSLPLVKQANEGERISPPARHQRVLVRGSLGQEAVSAGY